MVSLELVQKALDGKLELHDLPRDTKIHLRRGESSDDSTFLTFNRPDGMYSHCVTEKGNVCHLKIWSPIVVEDSKFWLKDEQEEK